MEEIKTMKVVVQCCAFCACRLINAGSCIKHRTDVLPWQTCDNGFEVIESAFRFDGENLFEHVKYEE